MITGAALTRLLVKTPPASQGRSLKSTARSSRWPLGMAVAPAVKALMPQPAVPAWKPCG